MVLCMKRCTFFECKRIQKYDGFLVFFFLVVRLLHSSFCLPTPQSFRSQKLETKKNNGLFLVQDVIDIKFSKSIIYNTHKTTKRLLRIIHTPIRFLLVNYLTILEETNGTRRESSVVSLTHSRVTVDLTSFQSVQNTL